MADKNFPYDGAAAHQAGSQKSGAGERVYFLPEPLAFRFDAIDRGLHFPVGLQLGQTFFAVRLTILHLRAEAIDVRFHLFPEFFVGGLDFAMDLARLMVNLFVHVFRHAIQFEQDPGGIVHSKILHYAGLG